MANELPKKYSLVRYWRYIFAPLVVVAVIVAWYVTFSLSPIQLSVGSLSKVPTPPAMPLATAPLLAPPGK
jgi:hypothetical protein